MRYRTFLCSNYFLFLKKISFEGEKLKKLKNSKNFQQKNFLLLSLTFDEKSQY